MREMESACERMARGATELAAPHLRDHLPHPDTVKQQCSVGRRTGPPKLYRGRPESYFLLTSDLGQLLSLWGTDGKVNGFVAPAQQGAVTQPQSILDPEHLLSLRKPETTLLRGSTLWDHFRLPCARAVHSWVGPTLCRMSINWLSPTLAFSPPIFTSYY